MMRSMEKCLWATVFGVAVSAGVAPAAITTINSNAADYQITLALSVTPNTTTFTTNGTTATIGYGGSGTGSRLAGILIFALPTLPAGGSIGDQTSLTATPITIPTATTPTPNTDLWGVGDFPAATTAVSYIAYSDTGTENPNPTPTDAKLVDNFFTKAGSVAGTPQTTATGVDNLLQTYLQAFYTANPTYDASVTQRYAFLRLNIDANVTGTTNRYSTGLSENATSTLRPVLNLDVVVPEPSSLALLGLAGIAALRRRR